MGSDLGLLALGLTVGAAACGCMHVLLGWLWGGPRDAEGG